MKRVLRKNIIFIAALLMVLGSLASCGMKEADAKEYVQAALDAEYKGEFDKYVEITNATEEEAKKMYDDNMNTALTILGMNNATASEELSASYKELLAEMFAKEIYTVGDSTKTKEGFEVSVTTQKMQIFEGLENDLVDVMQKRVKDMEGQPTEDEINTIAFEVLHELVSEKIADPVYGEEETLIVHVTKNDDGVWSISEDDLVAIDNSLIQ